MSTESTSSQRPLMPQLPSLPPLPLTPQGKVESKVQDRIGRETGRSVTANGHDITLEKAGSGETRLGRVNSATTQILHATPEETKNLPTDKHSFTSDAQVGNRERKIGDATDPVLQSARRPRVITTAWMSAKSQVSNTSSPLNSPVTEQNSSPVTAQKPLSHIDPPETKSYSKQIAETHKDLFAAKGQFPQDKVLIQTLTKKLDDLGKLSKVEIQNRQAKLEIQNRQASVTIIKQHPKAEDPLPTRIRDIKQQIESKKADLESKKTELKNAQAEEVEQTKNKTFTYSQILDKVTGKPVDENHSDYDPRTDIAKKISKLTTAISEINAEIKPLENRLDSLGEIVMERQLSKAVNLMESTITVATSQGKTVALNKGTRSLEIATPENTPEHSSELLIDNNYESANFILNQLANLDPLLIKRGYDTKVITALRGNPTLNNTINNNPDLAAKIKKMENRVTPTLQQANKEIYSPNKSVQIKAMEKIVQDKASHDLMNVFVKELKMDKEFQGAVKINEYKRIYMEHPDGTPHGKKLGEEIIAEYIASDTCNLPAKVGDPFMKQTSEVFDKDTRKWKFSENIFDKVEAQILKDLSGDVPVRSKQRKISMVPK